MNRPIKCEWLGLQDYKAVHRYQLELVEAAPKRNHDVILLCSHPPVVTLGKQSRPEDLIDWKGEVHRIERGGKATYHGPSQLIAYPIIDLRYYGFNLGGYLRALESSIVKLCQSTGLVARGNPTYAGVWIIDPHDSQEKKIASIGIAVRRWITYHGLAINLELEPNAFQGILSCGSQSSCMTALASYLQRPMNRHDIEQKISSSLLESLSQLSQSCQAHRDGRQ
jgi:lipoyl(octanoyl) transferase